MTSARDRLGVAVNDQGTPGDATAVKHRAREHGQAEVAGDKPWSTGWVWAQVADELRTYRELGFGRLLTEDAVRFCVARALVAAGVDVARLRVDAPHPALKGSRIDLLVGHPSPVALVELKFPREPNPAAAAWTMALGEVLKDFYRLAAYPGEVDRIFVYVETDRLHAYMAGANRRYGVNLDADTIVLHPGIIKGLPVTATSIIGAGSIERSVTARRQVLVTIDDSLRLAVYQVDPFAGPAVELPATAAATHSIAQPARHGARQEILDAIGAVLTRSGGDTFTPAEIVAEMARRGSRYADSTVRTMITAHLCHNAPDNAATTYDDLERTDRGHYRLAT